MQSEMQILYLILVFGATISLSTSSNAACDTLICGFGYTCIIQNNVSRCAKEHANCSDFSRETLQPGCFYVEVVDENGCDSPNIRCRECGENEVLVECGTKCPLTCEDVRHPKIKRCPAICILNVCECKEGFALDGNQRCISKEECLKEMTSNACASNAIDPMPCTTCVTTSKNEAKIIPAPGPGCCNDTEIVNCFISPCQSASISNVCQEAAHCIDNYCGGCIAVFYDADYNQICQ